MIAADSLNTLVAVLSAALPEGQQATLTGEDRPVTSISIDTRTLEPGQLFVAIKGPHFDGHNYAQAALDKGAAAVLVSDPVDCYPNIQVPNTDYVLALLGSLNRQAFKGTVVGVTGSSGKTSVKEMLAAIFGHDAPTLSTQGNFNNAYGVPLTLGHLTAEHQYAVIEMGTNSHGEIEHLTNIVQPHIALVNNASVSHVAGLGGLEGVVQEKGAIFDQLGPQGVAIINADDPHAKVWVERVRNNAGCPVKTFSLGKEGCDSWPETIESNDDGLHFTLHLNQQETPVQLHFWGRHQVANACAAAAIASAAGLNIETIAAGLGAARPYARRGQRFRTQAGAVVIDESYNANPDSTRAAMNELAECDGYRILVVGDLSAEHFETEEEGMQQNRELGEHARTVGIDYLLTCGQRSSEIHKGFQGAGQHFFEKQDLVDWLLPRLKAGVVVLVKGSMVTGMNEVVTACVEYEHSEQTFAAPATEGL